MTSYKFYLLEFDGYLVGATSSACLNDAEALTKASGLLGTFYGAVEVWHNSRKVGQIEAPPRPRDRPAKAETEIEGGGGWGGNAMQAMDA